MNVALMGSLLWKTLPKAATAGLVLVCITAAVDYGTPVMAAIGATAPVTLPFSLYIVVEQARVQSQIFNSGDPVSDEASAAAQAAQKVENFLLLACKGMFATLGWCGGALFASRLGMATSFWWLLLYAYGTWALVWKVLQVVHP